MLTDSISRSLSSSVCKNGPQSPKPALLMNRSTRRPSNALTRRRHSLFLDRSAVKISQTVVSWSDSFSSRFVRRATSSRLYPRAESWRANSAPIPELAPVITANFGIAASFSYIKKASPEGEAVADRRLMRAKLPIIARQWVTAASSPLIRPCGPPSPEGEGFLL